MRSDLLEKIAEFASTVHPSQIELLAKNIKLASKVESLEGLLLDVLPHQVSIVLADILSSWKEGPHCTKEELAAALLAASKTHSLMHKNQKVELVWTGPETSLVPIRKTEPVLLEVIREAKKNIWITSFVAYEVPAIRDAINHACSNNVNVNLLFEEAQSKGGSVSFDSIAKAKKVLPEARIFSWDSNANIANEQGKIGSMHAKCIVVDRETAFITSANITFAAIERNMELGVLIRGGNLPNQLSSHLSALCNTDIVKEVK
jgi:phosphatidylserine/phosphatidylglycerophosphate/cardiolipin synthase-like enzyme